MGVYQCCCSGLTLSTRRVWSFCNYSYDGKFCEMKIGITSFDNTDFQRISGATQCEVCARVRAEAPGCSHYVVCLTCDSWPARLGSRGRFSPGHVDHRCSDRSRGGRQHWHREGDWPAAGSGAGCCRDARGCSRLRRNEGRSRTKDSVRTELLSGLFCWYTASSYLTSRGCIAYRVAPLWLSDVAAMAEQPFVSITEPLTVQAVNAVIQSSIAPPPARPLVFAIDESTGLSVAVPAPPPLLPVAPVPPKSGNHPTTLLLDLDDEEMAEDDASGATPPPVNRKSTTSAKLKKRTGAATGAGALPSGQLQLDVDDVVILRSLCCARVRLQLNDLSH